MAKHSGQTKRDMFASHRGGAGKGDAPRHNLDASWRSNYDEVDWSGSLTGFERLGPHKQIKRYGVREAERFDR